MAPDRYSTMIDVLASRAAEAGDRIAFTFLDRAVTFRKLWEQINRFAAGLLHSQLQTGDRVVIALPNGPEFFYAFYGVQRTGGIAVPVFPGAGPQRIISLAELCGARRVVIPSDLPEAQIEAIQKLASKRSLKALTAAESTKSAAHAEFPDIRPDQIAFLQFTSGSTGNPKGVMITQANLLTNIRQMIAGMEITTEDKFVSWLPVYHDMGLILKTMVPFYLPAELHLLPTDLRDVRPWLRAIEEHQATFTAAPDFAYRLALRRVEAEAYDLSSLRVALNAAEPVRASTISAFQHAFGLEDVMVAGYGLAEVTVGVSMWKPNSPNRVDAEGNVSVGRPFPGVEVAIVAEGHRLPPGSIGEISIKSAANALGYYHNPEETARLIWQDGYLLSGDLGYLDEEGYLYIVGRKKNIIKRAGETIAPREIEEVVDRMAAVRFSAAVGVDRGAEEGEQVIVFAEIRDWETLSDDGMHEAAVRIVAALGDHMGFRPARLYLLKPKGIPLTDNGKIQHVRLRQSYLDGSLRGQGVILYPEY